MVRLQVQLEPAQHKQIKRRAKRLGVSVAEVIRRCVDEQMARDEVQDSGDRSRRALAVAGRYVDPSGEGRIAADHDVALAAAYRT